MNIIILTNDNYFSFTVLKPFLNKHKADIRLIVFSSALIGKRGTGSSILWSLKHTGFHHTIFKLSVYGIFRLLRLMTSIIPFLPNKFSTKTWTKRNKLECIETADVNAPEVVAQLNNLNPDLIISVSMNQIIKKEILEMPQHRCINVHCAPLPRYGGMSPYVWALANNEDHSAATIHYMDEGLDTGDIIAQELINVKKNDSAFCLFKRCCKKAAEMLIQAVNQIEAGTVSSRPQDFSQKSYYSWPDKMCIKQLKNNGYRLVKIKDILSAIFK